MARTAAGIGPMGEAVVAIMNNLKKATDQSNQAAEAEPQDDDPNQAAVAQGSHCSQEKTKAMRQPPTPPLKETALGAIKNAIADEPRMYIFTF